MNKIFASEYIIPRLFLFQKENKMEKEYTANVIKIEDVLPHPDPETINLGIVKVDGFTVIVNKNDWEFPRLCVYIEPDTIVNVNRPEFSFLKNIANGKDKYRVRVKKIRGVYSQGLLIPAHDSMKENDNVFDLLELEHWNPPEEKDGGFSNHPKLKVVIDGNEAEIEVPKYDVSNYNKYVYNFFTDNDYIVAHEKIHGTNFRATCIDGVIYVGGRNNWFLNNHYLWDALNKNNTVVEFLKQNENFVVYGEVYGRIQNLKYGLENTVDLKLFDIMYNDSFLDYTDQVIIKQKYDLPWVPLVYEGHFDDKLLRELAEKDSFVDTAPKKHIMEGLVIKPIREENHVKYGRKQLKLVSNRYYEKG